MSSQKIMSNDIVLFSECGQSQRVELAKEVLAGNRTISVLVTDQNGPVFAVDQRWGNKNYKLDPWTSFESGMCCIYGSRDISNDIAVPIPAESHNSLLFYRKLYKQEIIAWLREQGCQVFPGFWEIAKPRAIAADILAGVRLEPGRPIFDPINFNNQQRDLVWIELIKGENDKHYRELKPWENPRAFTSLSTDAKHHPDIKTPEYAICVPVHEKFWADYNGGDEYAKQSEIISWIEKKYHLSENQAKAVDKVIRPLGKPRHGGYKKIKKTI